MLIIDENKVGTVEYAYATLPSPNVSKRAKIRSFHMLLQTTCEPTTLAQYLGFKFMLELMVVSSNSHMTIHKFSSFRKKQQQQNKKTTGKSG